MPAAMKKIEIARALAAARGAIDREDAPDGGVALDLGELTRLPGLGRKRARLLHDELGIRTLEELTGALLDGRVLQLRGFGVDACERLRAKLQAFFARAQRFPLADAELHVAPLVEFMRALAVVERVELAGSVRRRCTTVGDVNLLVVSSRPALVMRQFASFPDADRVEAADTSRGSLVLRCGLRVDLRIVPRRCYGATLQFMTGSPEHNTQLRRLGLERGFRISEYGVFSVDHSRAGARRAGGQREEDVFAALGIEWVPPEMREGRGELGLAQRHALPRLVTQRDIRGDLNVRSRWVGGGTSVEALAHACMTRGYDYCAIMRCTRPQAADGHGRYGAAAPHLDVLSGEIAALMERLPGFRVLNGVSAGIAVDGSLESDDVDLDLADIVRVEIRSHVRLSRTRMTDRILLALEHPAVDILGWPSGRLPGRRETYDVDLDEVLAAAAARRIALELNAAPDHLTEVDDRISRARELGVTVVVTAGAREPETLDRMRYGVDQARRGWYEPARVLNTRSLAEIENWLRRRLPSRGTVLAGAG
jgi:DNA polymerase (family X)